jgi:hypothetical protein
MSVRKLWLAIALVAALAVPTLDAAAKSRSSRGYSAPSISHSAPPAAAPSLPSAPSAPAAPSSSGAPRSANGYGLPGHSAAAPSAPLGGSDAALSKQASGASLRGYDAGKERARFAQSTPAAAPSAGFSGYSGRFRSYDDYYYQRNSYYSGFGWQPPGYIYGSRSSFGMWDALFLWFMLDSLSNAGHAAWFYNHSDDPGYQQWRQEANRLSADNADLRAKLADLDAQQKALAGQPRDPNFMPPDAKPELALASENAVAAKPAASGPNWFLDIGLVALVLGGLLFLRRRVFA